MINQVNEFEQWMSIGDIHLVLKSAEKVYFLYFNHAEQNPEILRRFVQDSITIDFNNLFRIPSDAHIVELKTSTIFNHKGDHLFWRDSLYLYMAKDLNGTQGHYLSVIKIPVTQILYYKTEGNLHYEQNIYGGGHGEFDPVMGLLGLLGGGFVGALIAGRGPIQSIETETVAVDTREAFLLFIDKEGNHYTAYFSQKSQPALEWFIPDKEYEYVIGKRRTQYDNEKGYIK